MLHTFTAVYDGQVLRPEEVLNLEKDRRYRITVQAEPTADIDVWQVLEALAGTIDAPEDWSLEHDHYLYGTPKWSGLTVHDD